MSPLNITQPLDSIRYMVYNGYYKVMSNIRKMGHLTTPVRFHVVTCMGIPQGLARAKATSATDGCRDARDLVEDNLSCPLAVEMKRWLNGGHAERSFARPNTVSTRNKLFV